MSQPSTLKAVKIALSNEISHFNIRIIIRIISLPEHRIDLRKRIESSTRKIREDEAYELVNLDCGERLKVVKIGKCTYHLVFENNVYPFKGKDTYTSLKKNAEDEFAKSAFNIWLDLIGMDKNIFKKTPSMTTSKGGAYSKSGRYDTFIKGFRSGTIKNLEEVESVCKGCRTSLYHMGFDKYGRRLQKHFCDVQTIFSSRQRVEEFIIRNESGVDYTKQLCKLTEVTKLKTSMDNNTSGEGSPFTISHSGFMRWTEEENIYNQDRITIEDLLQ